MYINELVETQDVFIDLKKGEELPSLDYKNKNIIIGFSDDYKILSHTLAEIVNYLRKGNKVKVYTDSRDAQKVLEETRIYKILDDYGRKESQNQFDLKYAVNF